MRTPHKKPKRILIWHHGQPVFAVLRHDRWWKQDRYLCECCGQDMTRRVVW